MAFGVTAQGFVRMRLIDLLDEARAEIRAEFGAGAVTDDDGAFGKLSGIWARMLDLTWQAFEDLYLNSDPDGATDIGLDHWLALSGLERLGADASTFWARLDGANNTAISAGRTISNDATGDVFTNLAAVTLDALAALRTAIKVAAKTYTVGQSFTVTIDGTAYVHTVPGGGQNQNAVASALVTLFNVGQAITAVDAVARKFTVAGNHAAKYVPSKTVRVYGSTGNDGVYTVVTSTFTGGNTLIVVQESVPSGVVDGSVCKGITATDLTGTARVDADLAGTTEDATDVQVGVVLTAMPTAGDLTFSSVGTAGQFTASETGPKDVAAGAAFTLLTGYPGWLACTAVISADVGRDDEADPAARTRRALSVRRRGSGPVDAIRAHLLALDGVDTVRVIENDSDLTVDGRPPHSIEAIVEGGSRSTIAETIWARKGGGIQTVGNVSELVLGKDGELHDVLFSRPVDVLVYVRVTVDELDPEELLPADASGLIAASVVATGEALAPGADVIAQRFVGPIFVAVAGLRRITVLVDRSTDPGVPPPASTVEVIGSTERARFALARVTVDGL